MAWLHLRRWKVLMRNCRLDAPPLLVAGVVCWEVKMELKPKWWLQIFVRFTRAWGFDEYFSDGLKPTNRNMFDHSWCGKCKYCYYYLRRCCQSYRCFLSHYWQGIVRFSKIVIGIDELPLAPGSLRDVHRYHMFIVIPRAHEAYHSNLVERPLFQPFWKWHRAPGAKDAIGFWRKEWLGSTADQWPGHFQMLPPKASKSPPLDHGSQNQ